MPFQLYGLPAEIYDKIMEYALAAQLERRVLYAKDWNSWEANARKAHDPTMNLAMIPARRPPPLKVNEWLVSERFFLDTARIWFSVQRFDRRTQCSANLESVLPVWSRTAWRSEHQTFSMTPSAVMLSHRIGLFYTYATSVDVPAAMIPQVLRCRSLEYLRIELRPEDFDLDPRYGWKDVLTDSIRRRTRLNALPACKKVEVYCPEGSGVKWQFEPTRHQEMVLRSNVLLLQTLVQKKVAGQSVTRGSQLLKLVEEKLANTTIIRWSTRLDARIPRPLCPYSRVSTWSSVSFLAIHPIRAVCAWLTFMVAMFGLLIVVDTGLDKLSGMPAASLLPVGLRPLSIRSSLGKAAISSAAEVICQQCGVGERRLRQGSLYESI